MNPLRVSGSGYARFADFDTAIPEGTVAIIGPNGAGKSRYLAVTELSLFADGSRDLAQWLSPWRDRYEIGLTFEHDKTVYRVRRSYKPGKVTLDLERLLSETRWGASVAQSWEPLTLETTKATQQLICDTLGLSRATFNASSFLGQGNAAAFPLADPADRKKLLGKILDPRGVYPALAEAAGDRAKRCEIELAAANHEAGTLELGVVELPVHVATLERLEVVEQIDRTAASAAEKRLDQAQAAVAENAAHAERVRGLTTEFDHAKQERDRLAEENRQATVAVFEHSETRDRLAAVTETAGRLPALEHSAREQAAKEQAKVRAEALGRDAQRLREQHVALVKQRLALEEELDTVAHTESGLPCYACKRPLDPPSAKAVIQTLSDQLHALRHRIDEHAAQGSEADREVDRAWVEHKAIVVPAVDVSASLAEAREAVAERAALVERVAALEQTVGRIQEIDAALTAAIVKAMSLGRQLEAAQADAKDEARLLAAVETARETLTERRAVLEATVADVTRARQTVERLQHDAAQLAEVRVVAEELNGRLDLLRRAERMFGRDGIPTMIAENVIPAIEAEANRILDRLPTVDGVTFRVELRTQREKQDGALKEELHIVVCDLDGARPYETYSGGEKARVNIALRLALARLLAHRSGAEIRMLAVDELEYLDELGQEKLAEVLREAAADYDRVLVVSHAPGIRDAFESSIEVVKSGGVSRVLAPATDLAVAA